MFNFLLLTFFSLNIYATSVLVLGDSHTAGPFGWELDKALRASGHQVGTYGSSSSVPGWFLDGTPSKWGIWSKDNNGRIHEVPFRTSAPTPRFDEIVKQNPEVVIMAFGTNYATKTEQFAINDMMRFLNVLKERNLKCFWIAPPETRIYRSLAPKLFSMIKNQVERQCEIFASHEITHYPETGGDGIHYWGGDLRLVATKWAQAAEKAFTKKYP